MSTAKPQKDQKLKVEKFNPEKYPEVMCHVLENDTFTQRCNRCGKIVLQSPTKGYDYQCVSCAEDLHEFETHEGEYHSTEEYNELCLNTRETLFGPSF